jgi:hypothetical protein
MVIRHHHPMFKLLNCFPLQRVLLHLFASRKKTQVGFAVVDLCRMLVFLERFSRCSKAQLLLLGVAGRIRPPGAPLPLHGCVAVCCG